MRGRFSVAVGNPFALSRVAPAGCSAFSISRPHFPRNVAPGQGPGLVGIIDSLESWTWSRVSPGPGCRRRKGMSKRG
jgi:hypothetical protein